MKYPKKFKGEKSYIAYPKEVEHDIWMACELRDGGKEVVTGLAKHHSEESCWIVCRAHNQRVGYSAKKVKKIIDKFSSDEQERKKEKQKAKKPKGKKSKKEKKQKRKNKGR